MGDQLSFPEQYRANLDEVRLLNPIDSNTKPGYIALAKDSTCWQEVVSMPTHLVHEQQTLPGLQQWIERQFNENSYFGINSYFRPGSTYSPEAKHAELVDPITGRFLLRPRRNKAWLKNLNACWVDIDYYTLGLTKGTVVGQVIDATEAGSIPMPTLLKDSGRGLWVVWALDGCRAFDEKVSLWNAVQRALHGKFKGLGSDPKSLDTVRYTRLLGSLNTKSQTRVSMVVLADDTGNPPRYKLKALADKLGVVFGKQKRIKNPNAKAVNVAKGIKGHATRWQLDEARFWELIAIRGAIPEGIRNSTIQVCGAILKHRYFGQRLTAELNAAATRLFDAFETKAGYTLEPLPRTRRLDDGTKLDSVITQIYSAAKARTNADDEEEYICHQAISDALEITPSESAQLQERLGRAAWAPSSKHEQPPKVPNRTERRDLRQRYIELNWRSVANLSAVQLAEELGSISRDLECDQATAYRDRIAVGKKLREANPELFPAD